MDNWQMGAIIFYQAGKYPILQGDGTSVEIIEKATPQNIKSAEKTNLK
jgi:hypothetical protein